MANESLVTASVIGDVLDPFYSSIDLMVLFNGMPIVSGVELRSPTVSERPRVEIGGDDYRVAYTLVMVDPDAPNPSNPTLREYLHWMVTDIPASTDDTYGREAICYEAPNPTTGIHRMVLVLFRQLGRETVYAPSRRHNFSTRGFARRYNLGAPVAAMYFNCQRQSGSGGRRFTGPYTAGRHAAA
ncbi:Protein FLOWERING LOCUS T [Dichanthelium oligosanthes]|uniref:Protein FLOWERING LOCUS T n=1 Tax=Dichanthelium oligosanthes TaxID=888268 RepID=A0A1E5VEA2_9POAL|nr:Protein FLOWERING LOCUS T [Dichanthelium oligosanthes]